MLVVWRPAMAMATSGSPVTTLAYQSEWNPSASARSAWATTLSTDAPPPVNPILTVRSPCRMPYARATLYERTALGNDRDADHYEADAACRRRDHRAVRKPARRPGCRRRDRGRARSARRGRDP